MFRNLPARILNHFRSKKAENSDKNRNFIEKVKIGDFTYGLSIDNFLIWNEGGHIEIGKFCSFAFGVKIFSGGEHFYDRISTYPFNKIFKLGKDYSDVRSKGDVIIGNDVWVGYESIILSNVKIGNGAIIGARSVVSKDIPPYAIAVGNPIKIIKYRFSEEQIDKLNKIQWWNWNLDHITENIDFLYKDIDGFIDRFLNRENQN